MEDIRSSGIFVSRTFLATTFRVAGESYVLSIKVWNSQVGRGQRRKRRRSLLSSTEAYELRAVVLTFLALAIAALACPYSHLIMPLGAFLTGVFTAALIQRVCIDAIQLRTDNNLALIVVFVADGLFRLASLGSGRRIQRSH